MPHQTTTARYVENTALVIFSLIHIMKT